MPVSLGEWRVRIGTFVHWIREYEVNERRERLLKERIRRLKVLCERLEAKMGDSGEESEDDKSRQDGPDCKGCPHKTLNIRSSGNSSDIKDLLTPCDQCIQDLLSSSDHHIKELLTPSDTCIKQLLTPRRERLQRIQRLKVLCERLEAKMGDCGEESEDDKSRQDGPNCKGCPHETLNIRSSGNSSDIKDLLTSCDQCIQDLLTASDSHIKEIIAPSDTCIKQLLTPTDSNIRHLLSLTNSCRKDQQIARASHVEDITILTPNYSNIRELIIHSDSCFRELHMSADACTDDMLSDSDIKELLKPRDSAIIEILTPKDSCIQELLTPGDSYIQELLTPRDSYIRELLSVNSHTDESISTGDGYIQEMFTPRDSYTSESLTTGDAYIQDLLTQRDSYTSGILSPKDSYIIFTPGDSHTDESLTPVGSNTNVSLSLTPGDCYTNESLTQGDSYNLHFLSPKYSYIQELLTPSDSYNKKSPTPGDSYDQELFTPRDSHTNKLLKPTDSYANVLLTPGDSYIKELLIPRNCYANTSLAPEESYIQELLIGVQLESPRQGEILISPTSSSDSDAVQHGPSGGKEMANTSSRSSCHKTDSLKGTVDVMLSQQPSLTELLLVEAGDVELNPGPLHGSIDSLLQDSELIRLAEEVPVDCYNKLCTGLGFSLAQIQNVLTEHHFNFPGASIHFFCKWKLQQRDGTNCRALLGEILSNNDMGALQTKLLKGEYLTSGTSPSDPKLDTFQPFMTEAQVLQCGEDLKTFYREQMCKIKPDPVEFNIILEFEQIYTNLTLLRNKMGTRTKTPLDYTDLLTTKINGVLPKRLLVEGEGGVGKTTFCSKIAWDWVDGSPEFQRFSWVLVIPLRNVVKVQTIGDIMKNFLSDSNAVNPKQIDNYILSQPTKVPIVLDGLDEYDGEESSDISQILRLEKFKQCIVLVTTRPWRADKIKSNEGLSRSYAFIAVEGFSAENVSTYISKYFVNDEKAGSELCRFMEVNDVIKENMAPFPIYVAMLCILWKNCDSEKRETIRKLKTFSQLFDQMIMFLRDHYILKVTKELCKANLDKEMENTKPCLQRIGSIAFSGLLEKKLVFDEEDFSSCKESMVTCCRIGVLSQENLKICRMKRTLNISQSVTTSVFFPHKLFQEYVASLYLASLYETNHEEYSRSMGKVLSKNPQEFRYLLYFTAAQGREVGLDIAKKIQQMDFPNVRQRRRNNDFLADVTFEAYNNDTAKAVGQRIFADEKKLTFDKDKPAHTVSGYLFIMEQHGMETLVFRDRSCGPTVSRDLADVLFASKSLTRLVFYRTTLDDVFYQLMHTRVSTMAGDKYSIKELVVDHQFLNGLQRVNNGDVNVTIGDLFPSLTKLTFNTLHTVSPGVVERLAHSSLTALSIEHGKKGKNLVPLIGEPTSLGQLFSTSFQQLTCLTFRGLVMGNIRSEAILHNLKNHLHVKSISIIRCFTDNELNSLAKQITTENRMKISLQHKKEQRRLCFDDTTGRLTIDMIDALCHRTCVTHLAVPKNGVKIAGEECFPELHGREADSKIDTFKVDCLSLHDDQSASSCLGKFLSLLPHLTDLEIDSCSLHDDFYKQIANQASLSKGDKSSIKELVVDHQFLNGLQRYTCNNGDINVTVGDLFPSLRQLTFATCHTVSSGDIEWLAHPILAVLSIERGKKRRYLPLIGEPTLLGQLFSSSFPQLTCLTFRELVMGNIRSEAILRNLRNHLHLKSISIISCFTDDELDPLAEQITTENRMQITLQHDTAQRTLSFEFGTGPLKMDMIDALCHRTCVHHLEVNREDVEIPDLHDRVVDSKIETVNLNFNWHIGGTCRASKQLAKFICSLPCLTNLTITTGESGIDEFVTELASLAAPSQIQTVDLDFMSYFAIPVKKLSQSASKQLVKFLCSLPCLTTLAMKGSEYLHADFFTELGTLAESSQNPYFKEKKHMSLLQEWSASTDHPQKQQLMISTQLEPLNLDMPSTSDTRSTPCRKARPSGQLQRWRSEQQQQQKQWWSLRRYHQQQQLNQCERPMPSEPTHQQPYLPHHVPLLESAQPSGQFQSDPHRGIQSEPEQINQSTTSQQLSPITPFQSTFAPDQLTKQNLEEFEQYLQSYLTNQHNASNGHETQYSANSGSQETRRQSPHHGLGEVTQDNAISQRQEDATPTTTDDTSLSSSSVYINYQTSVYQGGLSYESVDNLAMPSTSGLSSAQSRTDAANAFTATTMIMMTMTTTMMAMMMMMMTMMMMMMVIESMRAWNNLLENDELRRIVNLPHLRILRIKCNRII